LRPTANKSIVLGIDPGLATTGWGVIEKSGNDLRLLGLGTIETSATRPLPERLVTIRQQMSSLLSKYSPNAVSMEQLFFTKFATSIAATAQARGVILVTAAEANIPVFEQNPRAVKIALTAFGSATKFQMQSAIQRQFRLKELPRPDDAADAVGMALCHLQTASVLKIPTASRRSRAQWEAELAAKAGVKI